MISDAIVLIDFLTKYKQKYQTKSALFSSEGTKIEGDNMIKVEKISTGNDNKIWFYTIEEVEGYEFVYMPVIPSLHIDYGTSRGENNPDARFFRFVGSPLARFSSGGEPNVKANFMVVAYKPKHLLGIKEDSN